MPKPPSPPARPVLLLAVLLLCLAAPTRAALTIAEQRSAALPALPALDDIVARNLRARGGAERLAALRSVRFTGKLVVGGDDGQTELGFAQLIRRPRAVRNEVTLQGLTAIDAFDGKEAWSLQPFGGRRDPERASADDARLQSHDADIVGPLLDWRQQGHALDLLGTEDIDGTPALKLRLRRKDGDLLYIYLDPETYLEIRQVSVDKVRGAERIVEVDLGSYTPVAGVLFPFAIEVGPQRGPKNARFTFERAEADVPADDALFRFPAPGQKVSAALDLKAPGKPAAAPAAVAPAEPRAPASFDAGVLSGLRARNIGAAAMSGRIAAVAARDEDGKTIVFAGSASGGLWRSLDSGTTFKPVFDLMPVQSIGAIAIDPSRPRTVWVGTGEPWTRNSTSIGDGVYRSDDNGETWAHVGLPTSERIARILVHPKDGNTVYVCVPGRLWSDSADRGVYKTSDGGKSWSLILRGANLSTGCSGLAMDPRDPQKLFAGLWDFRRQGWTFRSGGDGPRAPSGSALYVTRDGGATWTKKDPAARGLPAAPWGRVEVVVAPSDPNVVYAFIESTASALFRSADGGETWEARDRSQMMVWRPFYFARLVVDPKNPDRLFKPDLSLIVSEDGGRSFSGTGGGAHGDWHDLWIDPQNPRHVIGGDDGGLWISRDGGSRWWKTDNLPVSQFYHVAVDNRDPYQVYGGLQDNSTWVGDSSYPGGITSARWENLYGGDGFWAIPDPTDPDAVYVEAQGGFISRVDRRTHTARDIQPKAAYKEKLRWNWNTPIAVSPTQKATLYMGAQVLFRSRDRGDTWQRISPDLTTNDPQKQKQEQSGGVTVDNSSAEMHCSIYAIAESPKDPRLIWVGTDDGNLQQSRDGGGRWQNLIANVPGLGPASWVSWIEPSRYDAATAYVAFDRHMQGDFEPYVYKTTDFGKTFQRLVGPGSGVRGHVHVLREDPVRRDLLYLGTEFGLYISLDGGARFVEFRGGNFPSVPVRDIQIQPREHDLVLATHGRGIWIIDDLTSLRALDSDTLQKPAAFLPTRPVQQRMPAGGGWVNGDAAYVGENPPGGAVLTYYLRSRHLFGPIKLEILDASGQVIDTLSASKRRGLNRVSWPMRVAPPRVPRAASVAGSATQGPRVVPGTYTARLTRGTEVLTTRLTVGLDRRAPYSVADRKQQFAAVMKAHGLFGEMTELCERIDAQRAAATALAKRLPERDPLAAPLAGLLTRLDDAKKLVVATKEGGDITGEERIREHLDMVYGALSGWEGRPARYQVERVEVLRRELEEVDAQFAALQKKEVAPLNQALRARSLPPLPEPADEKDKKDKKAAAREPREQEPLEPDMLQAVLRCVRSRGLQCELPQDAEAAEARRERRR